MDHVAQNICRCFACAFWNSESHDWLYKDTILLRDTLSVRLGPRIFLFQCLQYEWGPEMFTVQLTVYPSISLYMVHLCILYFCVWFSLKLSKLELGVTLWCNQIGTVRNRTLFISLQLLNHMFKQILSK